MSKLWGGRFTEEAEAWVEEFGASISFDKQLVSQDIKGSIAHVTMLAKQGIVTKEEAEKIKIGLQYLLEEAKKNKLHFSVEAEDIHLNIEKMLIERIGEVGGNFIQAEAVMISSDRYALVFKRKSRRYYKSYKTIANCSCSSSGK